MENCDISGLQILRPFYPGADFEKVQYGSNSVVIDNPPFSILSKILKFYMDRSIKFFLFAPHLTLFSNDVDCTAIVASGDITYENGAKVKTSFLSNLFGDVRIVGEPKLYNALTAINETNKANLPKYDYPDNIITVSQVSKVIRQGIRLEINKYDCQRCRGLDSQRQYGKAIFGSGFILSSGAAAEKAAAEKAAAEKAAAEKEDKIIWDLSDKENRTIKLLDTIKDLL